MWPYLILNSLCFSILFLVRFLGPRAGQRFVLALIFLVAAFMTRWPGVDPFVWFYYFVFSLLVFRGAFGFRRWATARLVALDEEIAFLSEKLSSARAVLAGKKEETDALAKHANEISVLYDKIKELSQSLDSFETFLVLGEALSNSFRFTSVKLAIFNAEDDSAYPVPAEFYELSYAHFQGVFDKSVFLKDRKRAKAELFSFDRKVFGYVHHHQKSLVVLEPSKHAADLGLTADFPAFSAHPVFIDKKMAAVLLIVGIRARDIPMLAILTERFISEMHRVKLYEKVQMLAITDGLTGVYARRHLMERLEGEVDRARRFGVRLAFLMIDVDDFKQFNDHYGHLVGDVVLKQVAQIVQKSVREIDLVGRYGGEEFGVLLIETDAAGALQVAERIRRAVAEKSFRAYDENLKVTISIGGADFSGTLNEATLVVEAADSALYQAKRQGKNRVCLYA